MSSRAQRSAAAFAAVAIFSLPVHSLAAWAGAAGAAPAVSATASGETASGVTASSAPITTFATRAVAPRPPSTTAPAVSVAPARAPGPAVAAPGAPPAVSAAAAVVGQEATLIIPSLGIRLGVAPGGQATIDRGVVTHYQSPGWLLPVPAGAPGTYWLAAHHVTHGAPFGALPGIKVGALIIIDPAGGGEIRYTVTGTEVVGTTASYQTVYGSDATQPRILLQTCEGGAYRLLVHGVRIS